MNSTVTTVYELNIGWITLDTIQYNTIQHNIKICYAHNVGQSAESEARVVTGGTWQG